MSENWLLIFLGGLFGLLMGRSALIAFWPESEAAKFCEAKLGFLDAAGDGDSDDGECGGDGGGGD